MNDDELKKLWQQQPLRDPAPSAALTQAQLTSAMQNKTSFLRRCLDARDLRELLACAFIIIIFGGYFFYQTSLISRLGGLIVIGGAIFIVGKLVYARRTSPPAPPGATVVESLRAELHSVRTQSKLLGTVLWWYLLPLTVGELVFTWGNIQDTKLTTLLLMIPINIVISLVIIAINVFVYRLNKSARLKQLLPLETQLLSLLHSAETGEPLDETQVSELRPIYLSMAAADKVRPVEFKVAFWQLAVFGMPGVIGIWFFLILSFTIDNQDEATTKQAPVTVTQTVPTNESERYSMATRKIVDLLNAGDYSAVQKMYNSEMSKALPPVKTSEFYKDLCTRYGNIEKFDGPTGDGYLGWIAFRLHCQRGELTMSLVLDTDDKISGIYFNPTPKLPIPPMNIKSFGVRLFSWQHLTWLPPFFLASLLYTWIIQKTTERAVGISTLGIHLRKGQTLVVWDEIKEVQPMKFLHIKNLWLIRESGEKTIMHWTPLEQHPDLRAAVEGCAPANHPIRKYLSLLK